MIQDHRPLYIKRLHARLEAWYANYFVAPQFDSLGSHHTMMKPWYVNLSGRFITAGDNLHIVAAPDRQVSFSTWQFEAYQGHITLGDHCLVCPAVRFDSGSCITVGDNCMFAAGSYVTDADWHDIYDRTQTVGQTRPVHIEDNVWVGDGAVVCKGVTIGKNSVIGAGSIVTGDIPPDVIAAGNPARVIKPLDPDRTLVTRASLFTNPEALATRIDQINRYVLGNNTTMGWIRSLLLPRRGD